MVPIEVRNTCNTAVSAKATWLLYQAHEKLMDIVGRHGVLDMFMDVSHTIGMAICVVNQLKNNSY